MIRTAAGDVALATDASEAVWSHISGYRETAADYTAFIAPAALARGDLTAARCWADDAVLATTGWYRALALTTRARVAIAQGVPEQAVGDAHDALACAVGVEAYLGVPDILEVLAGLAGDTGSHREAARLFGAAEAIRQRTGEVRFPIYQAGYEASVGAIRNPLGDSDFDGAWAEGAALSTDEAIAYAQRGRGDRRRPASGWASLTPAERDVVRLVSEGLGKTTSPCGSSSHRGPCKPTSPTSTPNSASPPASSSFTKQPATPDRHRQLRSGATKHATASARHHQNTSGLGGRSADVRRRPYARPGTVRVLRARTR